MFFEVFGGEKLPYFKARVQPNLLYFNSCGVVRKETKTTKTNTKIKTNKSKIKTNKSKIKTNKSKIKTSKSKRKQTQQIGERQMQI